MTRKMEQGALPHDKPPCQDVFWLTLFNGAGLFVCSRYNDSRYFRFGWNDNRWTSCIRTI